MIDAWDKGLKAAQGDPERNRRLALAILGAVATPAKNIASIFGAKPEGHEPPVMFPVGRSEDRWNRGMMKDLAKEGNWKGAMDYAGRVDATEKQQKSNVADAALGFAGTVGPGKPIRAYHGSPHDFDKFSMSKIGTGEGAQAYGHGLYFAGNEGVARSYRDALATNITVDGNALLTRNVRNGTATTGSRHLDDRIVANLGDMKKVIADLEGDLASRFPNSPDRAGVGDALRIAKELEARGAVKIGPHQGKMYEVNIHADPNKLLDWDKPIAAQGPIVDMLRKNPEAAPILKALATTNSKFAGMDVPLLPAKGSELYQRLGISDNNPARGAANMPDYATGALKDAGIPGIKYLDQGSRAAGDGSRNYVMFDDSLIEILRKYGLVPPVAVEGDERSRLKKALTK